VALTLKQQMFVTEFLKDLNMRAALRRAGYSEEHHHITDSPEVADAIAKAYAERHAQVKVEASEVLRHVLAVATVDPNEIMEVRRGCCRHCHGIEHRYQYTTQRELNRARSNYNLTDESLVEEFEHGGLGFNAQLEPHAGCPQCGGEGSAYAHVKDTRHLSAAARSLYAGVKQTKDGIEVKLNSQDKSRELLMRHLGLLNDKLEVTGDLGDRIIASRKRARGG
jgi:phage terminase small subunit